MKGFDRDEFELKLVPYTYDKGRSKVKWDYRDQQPYNYELYRVFPYYYPTNILIGDMHLLKIIDLRLKA
jgi:hypothetical protein